MQQARRALQSPPDILLQAFQLMSMRRSHQHEKYNKIEMVKPGVIKAEPWVDWPSRGLSCVSHQSCASKHTQPHPGPSA